MGKGLKRGEVTPGDIEKSIDAYGAAMRQLEKLVRTNGTVEEHQRAWAECDAARMALTVTIVRFADVMRGRGK